MRRLGLRALAAFAWLSAGSAAAQVRDDQQTIVPAPYSKDAPVLLYVRVTAAERLPGKVILHAEETEPPTLDVPPGRKWLVETLLPGDGPIPPEWNVYVRFHSVMRGYQSEDRACTPECRVLARDITTPNYLMALLGHDVADAASVMNMKEMGWLVGCWARAGRVMERWKLTATG